MKSLRARLTIWFAASLVLVLVVFVAFTYHVLDSELRAKNWRRDYPEHPDWRLHGSFSEEEVQDVLGELLGTSLRYGLPLALAALGLGYWLARKSVTPISRVNEQLANIRAQTLSQRIALAEVDDEFRDLVRHINELLERLDQSFTDMSDYAAKVAHELRTPLAILRLKIEHAGPQIPPDLAETLQAELHQLCHVVDQSLLIAKAEQGRLVLHPEVFDLAHLVSEVAEDFALLAQEDDRTVRLLALPPSPVRADPKYARQIVQSLLANALKHGQGDVQVKLTRSGNRCVLTLANRQRVKPPVEKETLGLGLRVVDSLLELQPEVRCRRRSNAAAYVVRLSFPISATRA